MGQDHCRDFDCAVLVAEVGRAVVGFVTISVKAGNTAARALYFRLRFGGVGDPSRKAIGVVQQPGALQAKRKRSTKCVRA